MDESDGELPVISLQKQTIPVTIVLLAAGRSSRMGSSGVHKLLSEFQGVPLIRRSTITACNCRSHSVIVVTGYRHLDIESAIAGLPVTTVHNTAFSGGMAGSLALGVRVAEASQPDGIMVMLADMPALTTTHLNALLTAFGTHHGKYIARAVANGHPGNPVVFPSPLYSRLKGLTGDKGARDFIQSSGVPIIDVELGDSALIDVDTPEAVEAAGGILR